MSGRVLVTGAGGNVGREVVRALTARGVVLRAADHDPARARERLAPFVERAGGDPARLDLVGLDFFDPSSWPAALSGCDAVFLLRPPAIAKVRATLNPFVDAARDAGAAQVVFLSVAGAGENRVVPHHKVEVHLQAAGAPFTILRPGFFAQNLQDAYLRDVREDDRLFVPAGHGRVAFIDLHDVAEVAAEALTDPARHAGAAYTLTGPEALSFTEVARVLAEGLGRPIRYEPASAVGYLRHLRRRRQSWGQALVQTVLHLGLRRGAAEVVDPTLERLLHRPGRTLATYVAEHAQLWRR